jgi:soluble lytic murein transglycosylase-like protein
MARSFVVLALLGALVLPPGGAAAQDIYSFVDDDGVIHVTNVPQDKRFHRVRTRSAPTPKGVYRIALNGRTAPVARRHSAYDEHIRAAAQRHGVAPPLLKAVMAVESNFDPFAISVKGATGLMQLMPATARDMYVADMFDPAQNIDGGARYLRFLQDTFGGDLEKVLAAYNAGPEAVRRSGGTIPAIPETQAYVRRVISVYDQYMKAN